MTSLPASTLVGPGRPDSIEDQVWIHQGQLVFSPKNLEEGNTHQPTIAERAGAFGLEPNKSAYKSTLASIGAPEFHHESWFSKLLGDKPKPAQPTTPPLHSELRPCTAKECKPVAIPPKPCTGSACPKGTTGSANTVCQVGFPGPNGTCQPWGYLERCAYPGALDSWGHCRVRWALVDSSYCWQILRELKRQQELLQKNRSTLPAVCSASASAECGKLTEDLNQQRARIEQLKQQYRFCSASASRNGATMLPDPSSLDSGPTFPWP